MDLGLDTEERNGFAVLAVQGEVDVYTAPQLREQLISLVDAGQRNIVVNLEGVEFLDSTGLGVLVGGLKRVRSAGGRPEPGVHAAAHPQGARDHRPHQGVLHPRFGRRGHRRDRVVAPLSPDVLSEVVSLEIPARPSYVSIARMAVGALAGLRTGFSYERIDDLRIVTSEACTSAIEALDGQGAGGEEPRLRLRCIHDLDGLTITLTGPPGTFAGWKSGGPESELRVTLMSALVDAVIPGDEGTELRLVMLRRDEDADEGDDEGVRAVGRTSDHRPGIRVVGEGRGEGAVLQQPFEAAPGGHHFLAGQQRAQALRPFAVPVEVGGQAGQVGGQHVGDGLTLVVPDDGAQLQGAVEAEAMVDAPDVPAGAEQTVARLPVGVVGHHVEEGELAEPVPVLLPQGEEVVLGVMFHELLHHPRPGRSVPEDGERHDRPAERLREHVGGRLPLAQRPGGEVPQRPFAPSRACRWPGCRCRRGRPGPGRCGWTTRASGPARRSHRGGGRRPGCSVGVPVQLGADVAVRVQGVAAQRARGRPASTVAEPWRAMARAWPALR